MRVLFFLAAFGAVSYAQQTSSFPCQPGTYSCRGSSIYVCTGQNKNILSANCNSGCCQASGGVAHCVC